MKGIAALAPTLLLTLILTSCMSDGYTDTAAGKSDTYINLNVSTPTAQARANAPANTAGTSGTLGQDETSPSPTEEEKIYSIRVWAFKSDTDENAAPIGFKAETGLNETGSHQVSMKLLRKAAGDLENIDLFILLNAESIGVLNNNNCNRMTRKELNAATFNSNFGINPDGSAQAKAVPATGLPISRVITNINVKNNIADNAAIAATKPVSVPLVRAVSKLHFFFARKTGKDTESVTVTRIEVNGVTLTAASPVFPEAATNAEKDTKGLKGSFNGLKYLTKNLRFGAIATNKINPVADPKIYIRKDGEKAQKYMTRLSTGVKEGCRSYLRETDKTITGKIYFKSNASLAERSVEFKIPDAYRNHELVVYGYFSGEAFLDNFKLQYYVANWNEKAATDIKFN
ncbi:hypothetical protein CFT61_07835 [Segatella copri]|uniref:Major fimbrial subunit protein N-terminal domain-containing protein n=1 Tax=Segatella copri TaxID=165179 RepID=A0AA91YX06_9BACT|nr:hypothetical protein [Segatella copri]OXL44025.1 hypothetical protein CFT61_07835 [Segatella copri]